MKKLYFFLVAISLATLTSNFNLYAQCPTIVCPADMVVNNDSGSCGAVVSYSLPLGFDVCQLDSMVFNYSGVIDTFVVPPGVGLLTIKAIGAQGGGGTVLGGKGAYLQGDITVSPGDSLLILVGQTGQTNYGYGGGGGSFVSTINLIPLVVAGGGGGAEHNDYFPGYDAVLTTSGMDIENALGGTSGNGGQLGNPNTSGCGWSGSGGGGFFGNGDVSGDGGGTSFVNGGAGGVDPTANCVVAGLGGFGGGGASGNAGGGGGGYSGGAGGANIGLVPNRGGGGGGSYNAGTNQNNIAGYNNAGNGEVRILYYAGLTPTLISGLGSGSTFPIGSTVETYVVADTIGNTDTCSFMITVNDVDTPQFVSCVPDTNVCSPLISGMPSAVVNDNCTPTITYSLAGATSGSGAGEINGVTLNVGLTTVTYIATDGSGNADSCSFNINVYSVPAITTSASDTFVCITGSDVTLTGSPSGGTWSGTGVSGSLFSPSTAGVGVHSLTYTYTTVDGCDATDVLDIEVSACTGLLELGGINLAVFPNPTNGKFYISFSEPLESVMVKILAIDGKQIWSRMYADNNLIEMDITEFADGIYLIQLNTGSATKTIRVVKN